MSEDRVEASEGRLRAMDRLIRRAEREDEDWLGELLWAVRGPRLDSGSRARLQEMLNRPDE